MTGVERTIARDALLARVGGGLFQQAFVVDDFEGAQQAMQATLGCGEFVTLPATDIEYDFRGGRTTCALEIGFARSGNVQIELLRPVRGVGLHSEFLATNGPGAAPPRLPRRRHRRRGRGRAPRSASSGVQGATFGALRFCYLDTWDAFGLYVELVEDPEAMMMALMPWR